MPQTKFHITNSTFNYCRGNQTNIITHVNSTGSHHYRPSRHQTPPSDPRPSSDPWDEFEEEDVDHEFIPTTTFTNTTINHIGTGTRHARPRANTGTSDATSSTDTTGDSTETNNSDANDVEVEVEVNNGFTEIIRTFFPMAQSFLPRSSIRITRRTSRPS